MYMFIFSYFYGILKKIGDIMQDENMFERLIKEGYQIDGHLSENIRQNDMSSLTLETKELGNSTSSKKREDKSVVIRDSDGNEKRVSSIMMGYNKQGIHLADGTFVNADELVNAINKAIESQASGKIVITKKGYYFDMENLLKTAKTASGKVTIGNQHERISNQTAKRWSISGSEGKTADKGVVFLGKGKIALPSGDYIDINAINKALDEYIILSNPEKNNTTISEEKIEQDKKRIMRVQRKYKNKFSFLLGAMAYVSVLFSGLSVSDVNAETIKIIDTIEADYDIDQLEYTEESLQETIDCVISNMELGGTIKTQDGDTLNTNSLLTGVNKSFGNEFDLEGKTAGDYRITGIAVISQGKILDHIEDFNGQLTGISIDDFTYKVCQEKNVDMDDINVRIHLGSSSDMTRAGWGDVTDLITRDDITDDMIKRIVKKTANYRGSVESFNGETITLPNGAVIRIVDESNNLLQNGSRVVGSDGREYEINSLNIIEKSYDTVENIAVGQQLEWSIEDCELAVGLLPIFASIGAALMTKKKNRAEKEKPIFIEIENDEKYHEFIEEFKTAKKKFEGKSKFSKMVKSLFTPKSIDELRELDSEQMQELYGRIMEQRGVLFGFPEGARLSMESGRINVVVGTTSIDITDRVMPIIKDIANKNKVIAEGICKEEEIEHAIRRR